MNINCMKVPAKLNTNTNINTISNANKKTNATSDAKLYVLQFHYSLLEKQATNALSLAIKSKAFDYIDIFLDD